jgi:hypothetical protein
MEIGPARRVIEVDPVAIPVPEHLPDPEPSAPAERPSEPARGPVEVPAERAAADR